MFVTQSFVAILMLLFGTPVMAGSCLPMDMATVNILEQNEGLIARPLSEEEVQRYAERTRIKWVDAITWFEPEEVSNVYVILGFKGCVRGRGVVIREVFERLIEEHPDGT